MRDTYDVISAIVPELEESFTLRFKLLQTLAQREERMGRQVLAQTLNCSERNIRTAVTKMQETGLVEVNSRGVSLTAFGQSILAHIEGEMHRGLRPFHQEEALLAEKLGASQCIIIPGEAKSNSDVFRFMGEMIETILIEHLPQSKAIIAVTGGQTLAQVSLGFSEALTEEREVIFVPTRGGLGGRAEIQSTSVGSLLAQQTGGEYIPLYMPENIDLVTSETLAQERSIHDALVMAKEANALLLSVGSAGVMAERRDLNQEQRSIIREGAAIGEAFGTFFDKEGQLVLKYPRVGMQLTDLEDIPLVITIVTGAEKASVVEAFYRLTPNPGWLICDESLARTVLNGETLLK